MSKTKDSDYYITPIRIISDFMNEILLYEHNAFRYSKIIFDPCAGGDTVHPMSYPEALSEYGLRNVYTMDIRQDSLAEMKGDYLETKLDFKPDIIITNPPSSIAREVIEKALFDVADGGLVVMLLRLNFFGSIARKEFWNNNMPKYTFVHHKRISFSNNGKTASEENMHCVWKKDEHNLFTNLRII